MAKVIVLCGKIASGKSFYADRLKEKIKAIILSLDSLMLKLSDSCLGKKHDDIADRCQKYLYELAEQIIKTGTNVIIDYGYWSRKERLKARNYFLERGIEVEIHYIKKSEETRIKQLEERNIIFEDKYKKNPNERLYIINHELRERLDAKFEEPLADEIDQIIDEKSYN